MADAVSIPPPGFDDLTTDEKIRYVQELWDRVAAGPSRLPVPDWHRRILDERVAEYHADPNEGEAWPDVRNELLRELAELRRGRD